MINRVSLTIVGVITFGATLAMNWPRGTARDAHDDVPAAVARAIHPGNQPTAVAGAATAPVTVGTAAAENPASLTTTARPVRQMGHHVAVEDVMPRDRDPSAATLREAQAERPVPVALNGASLRNMSGANLEVRVTARGGQTGALSMISVTLPPGREVPLAGAGLVFQRGDELTISSPPYRDRVLR